jgi:hypothetical protein
MRVNGVEDLFRQAAQSRIVAQGGFDFLVIHGGEFFRCKRLGRPARTGEGRQLVLLQNFSAATARSRYRSDHDTNRPTRRR